MADDQKLGYGFASDDVKPFNLHFGLNSNTYLVKFEFNPNAGKDNSEAEALDLTFDIGGTERNLRIYPVGKVYNKERKELTDTTTAEYVKFYNEQVKLIGGMITHVLHCFTNDIEGVKAALSRPFVNFKQYATAAKSLLPANFSKVELDIFLQYQWNPSDGKNVTYLEIPRNMKHGKWLCKHMEGSWKEERYEEQGSGEPEKALRYVDGENRHLFTKSAWYMSNNFAKRTNADGQAIEPTPNEKDEDEEAAAAAMNKETGNGTVTEQMPSEEPESSQW